MTTSPAAAFAQAPVGVQRTVRDYISYAGRWLGANVDDVVRIEPSGRATLAAPAPALMPGLLRWRTRLERRRAVALARRWLLVALAAGILLQLIALADGAGRTSRELWLIGPALLCVAGAVIGLRHRRLKLEAVARLLDHDLALAEVVSTALELEHRETGDRAQPAADGLSAMVLEQGSAVVARSLGTARVASRSGWRERVAPAALAAVLGLVIALPSSGSGTAKLSGVVPHGAAAASRGPNARGAIARGKPPAAGSAAGSASRAGVTNAGTEVRARPSRGGGQVSTAPIHAPARQSSGKPTAGSLPQRSAGTRGAGTARGPEGAHARGAGQPAGGAESSSISSGASGSPRSVAGAPRGGSGSHLGARGSAARAGRAGAPSAPGKSAAASSKASAALAGHHGAAGGEGAGRARGSNAPGARRPAPGSLRSASGLPIQAGYEPSTGKSVTSGSHGEVSGGRGPTRNSTVTGAGAARVTVFPYIPPTPSLLPTFDAAPVLSYFGPFSLLLSAAWW